MTLENKSVQYEGSMYYWALTDAHTIFQRLTVINSGTFSKDFHKCDRPKSYTSEQEKQLSPRERIETSFHS